VLALLVVTEVAPAGTIIVPDHFPQIQEAIEVAVPGDVVQVRPGLYVENLNFLGKDIVVESMQGAAFTVIDAGGGPGDSDGGDFSCCIASPTGAPGCQDDECEAMVCEVDPFCCDVAWDGVCADLARDICGGCGGSVVTFIGSEGPDAVLRGFTLRGGTGTADFFWARGGGIYCAGGASPTIEDNVITDNHVTTDGGGIYVGSGAAPTFIDTVVSANSTDWYNGGGLYATGATLTFTGCTFTGNSSDDMGGGMLLQSCTVSIVDCTFNDNVAVGDDGGGLKIEGGFTEIRDSTFSGNSSNDRGGGLDAGGDVILENNVFSGNVTRNDGGGFAINDGGAITIIGNTISGNTATIGHGGGIKVNGGPVTIIGNTITDNWCRTEGGGLLLTGAIERITDNTVSYNFAQGEGGGMEVNSSVPVVIARNVIVGNTAIGNADGVGGKGGGIKIASVAHIVGNVIQDNTVHDLGGGIFMSAGTGSTIAGNLISGNKAQWHGGGVFTDVAPLIVNNTIVGNVAGESGGGIRAVPGTVIANSVLHDNIALVGREIRSDNIEDVDVQHCLVTGGWPDGVGNFDAEPAFVDIVGPDGIPATEDDDLRPTTCSATVNAGSDALVPPDTADVDQDGDTAEPLPLDLSGAARFAGTVDIGCYELPAGGRACPVRVDCNGNGVRDEADIADCDGSAWCLDCNGNGRLDPCDLVPQPIIVNPGRAYWRFEHGDPLGDLGKFALDGVSNTASLTADVPVARVPHTDLLNMSALNIDGGAVVRVKDRFNVASFGSDEPNDFTIEAWVRIDTLGSNQGGGVRQCLVQKKAYGEPDRNQDYSFFVQGGTIQDVVDGNRFGKTSNITGRELVAFMGEGANTWSVTSHLTIDDHEWHHMSVAFDASESTFRFGVDGVFDTIHLGEPRDHYPSFGNLTIGAHRQANGFFNYYVRGAIDELRISGVVVAPGDLLFSLPPGVLEDCNANEIPDGCDLDSGASSDVNLDGVPDECGCVADVDGDGDVGFDDLLALFGAWGACGGCPEDLDGDGVVGVSDIGVLLSLWGDC